MRSKTRLDINLSCLKKNISLILKKTSEQKILMMIKADAYGHGMLPVVEYSNSELGIRDFGCASLGEAICLRDNLTDLEFNIFVFSELDLDSDLEEAYYDSRIIPVISDFENLNYFLSQKNFKNVPLCLKFNTGMNRLGFLKKEVSLIVELLKQQQRTSIFHLMSHLANSSIEIKEECMVTRQYAEFKNIKRDFISENIQIENSSMANSGAIEQGFSCREETHVRPGLLVYGASSLIPKLRKKFVWEGELVSSLQTKILKKFAVKRGDPIGYGAVVAPKDCTMILLPIGYGDGLFRSLEKCKIFLNGIEGSFFGRINMDMANVMFDTEQAKNLKVGDEVSIWNNNPESLYLLSDQMKTIAYEVLCHIGQRVPRNYITE